MSEKRTTYYEVLGLPPEATVQEIKDAYRDLIMQTHPDRNPETEEATEESKKINEAYSVLKDPAQRFAYDLSLRLPKSVWLTPEGDTAILSEVDDLQISLPNFTCERCGKLDATLRSTTFIYVVSVIFFSWKKMWGEILCSSCRLRYSLLWNLYNWIAGWWSIPLGPWYTIEALIKNSTGGIQPDQNNSDILAVTAYELFNNKQYSEAIRAMEESLLFHYSKNGYYFLDHIKTLEKRKFQQKTGKKIPAFFFQILLHGSFILFIAFIFFSAILPQSQPDSTSVQVPDQTVQELPKTVDSTLSDREVYEKYKVDLSQVRNIQNEYLRTMKEFSLYIQPYTKIDSTLIDGKYKYNFEIDRYKLDENTLEQYAENLSNLYSQISAEYERSTFMVSPPSEDAGIKLQRILSTFKSFVLESYYNVGMLAHGVSMLKAFSSQLLLPPSDIQKIKSMCENADVRSYIYQLQMESGIVDLFRIIDQIESLDEDVRKKYNQLLDLHSQVEKDSIDVARLNEQILETRDKSIEDYKQANIELNNKKVSYEKHTAQCAEMEREINAFRQKNLGDSLENAFNKCIDARAIFRK